MFPSYKRLDRFLYDWNIVRNRYELSLSLFLSLSIDWFLYEGNTGI